jgi:DnaJ family protein C protein 2
MDFDDFVPEDRVYKKSEFFEIFTPVFKRNAHYSKKQPTPEFGDMDTHIKKVHRFYDFWYAFKHYFFRLFFSKIPNFF